MTEKSDFSKNTLEPFVLELQSLINKLRFNFDLEPFDVKRLTVLKSLLKTYKNLMATDIDVDEVVNSDIRTEKKVEIKIEEDVFDPASDEADDLLKEFELENMSDSESDSEPLPEFDTDRLCDEVKDNDKLMLSLFELKKKNSWFKTVHKKTDKQNVQTCSSPTTSPTNIMFCESKSIIPASA